MEQVNTLKMYREYKAAGYTEEQAITAAESLNSSFTGIATRQDLLLMEANLKQFVTWEIVMLVLALMALPIISDKLPNIFRRK